MASNAGPYTMRRINRHDLSHIAINPSNISPTANMQQIIVLANTLPLTPAISIPENRSTLTLIHEKSVSLMKSYEIDVSLIYRKIIRIIPSSMLRSTLYPIRMKYRRNYRRGNGKPENRPWLRLPSVTFFDIERFLHRVVVGMWNMTVIYTSIIHVQHLPLLCLVINSPKINPAL